MAAALGPPLVFEDDAQRTQQDQLPDETLHVERASVTRIAVDDDTHVDRGGDTTSNLEDLRLGQQPDIGFAQVGGGHAEPGEHDSRKAGLSASFADRPSYTPGMITIWSRSTSGCTASSVISTGLVSWREG